MVQELSLLLMTPMLIENFIRRQVWGPFKRLLLYSAFHHSPQEGHFNRFLHKVSLIKPSLVVMKLDTPHFRAIFTPELKELADLFRRYGHEIRIAGGAVRDLLMYKQPDDIDFATTATPNEMKEMFQAEDIRMINATGEKHGTVTARINEKQNFEVTTLRIDVKTDGRHAEVEFTKDWLLDAGRRDLTINAMFLGLDGTVFDYFHGIEDLKKRRLAFVGDPSERIQEDYLRILRYFRFYGRISVEPDCHEAQTLEAIRENMGGLSGISGERIWVEMKKIFLGNHCKAIVERMIDLGIAPFVGLPFKPNVEEFRQVCDRSQTLQPQPMTLIAGLFQNMEEVMQLHSRLKLSNYERDLACFVVQYRDDKLCDDPLRPYQILVLKTKGKLSDIQEWVCEVLKYRGDVYLLEEFRGWQVPKFPVNGHMLIDRGVKSGPRFTKIMMQLKELWIDSNFTLTADQLLEHLPSILENMKVSR